MNMKLKSSQVSAVIGICAIVLLILFTQLTPPQKYAATPPQTQLAQVSPTATLTLSPLSNSIALNGTFTVTILLNTGGQAIYGVDINRLRFNPAVLQVVDADAVKSGVQISPGSLMPTVFLNTVDNVNGTVQFSQVATPGTTYSNTTGSALATITFKGVGGGTANVTMDFTSGSGTDSNIAGANGDILTSVSGGTYTVSGGDTTAPTAPGTPTLTVQSATQINLAWPASTDNVGVTAYRVERCSGSATCTGFAYVATTTTNSYSNTGLTASTIYRYQIKAADAAGNMSSASSPANATTQAPADTTAPTISNITISNITTTGATISWTTNEAATAQVDYGLASTYGSNSTLDSTLLTNHAVILSGLSPGTSYHYRVQSKDAAGNTSNSADNVFTTTAGPDTTAPTVPGNITVTPTSETEIQVSWVASTDPAGAGQNSSGVSNYQIYRDGVLLTTSPTTAYLDTGLTGGTAYGYQISAVDGANNVSAKSAVVTGTTPTYSLAVQRRIVLIPEGAPATKRNVTGTIDFLSPTSTAQIYQSSITTDGFGRYTMNVPSGLISTVNMRASMTGYLTKVVTGVDLRNSALVDVTFPTLPSGDFNSDKAVNSLDFSYMNGKWGGADTLADINRDGEVNSLDFAFLSINWQLVGE